MSLLEAPLSLMLAALTLAGCRTEVESERKSERELEPTKVTADAPADATENAPEPTVTPVHEPITNFDGIGWRIRDGLYEDAIAGLRLRPPAGWRYIVGAELDRMKTDASLMLINERADAVVALTIEGAPEDKLAALAELSRHSYLKGKAPLGEPLPRTIAGQQLELRRYERDSLAFVQTVYVGGNAITSISGWHRKTDDDGLASIDAVLNGFEPIPASERATLREQLLEQPKRQRRFHPDRAFRASEFVDFAHQLRWTMPPGLWEIVDFDKALRFSADTVLSAGELERGVYLELEAWVDDDEDPAATLSEIIADDELRWRDTIKRDGLTIHRAQAYDHSQDPPLLLAVAITRRDDRLIAMTVSTIDDSPTAQATIDAAFDGLDFTPELERTRLVGRTYSDLLHGFAFQLPPGFDDLPQTHDGRLGQVSAWLDDERQLVAVVLGEASDDQAAVASTLSQALRSFIGVMSPVGEPERSEATLGSLPAQQLTWNVDDTQLRAQCITRAPLVYCMVDTNLSDADREQLLASFALLE